jgi:hypothetical protein
VLDGAGIGPRVRGRADLARVPPTDLHEITDPGALVLRPDLGRILRHGHPALAARGAAARVAGAMPSFSRHVERRFKPVLWVLVDGVPIGYSTEDVSRLARRGAAWLERAGVGKDDVLVSTVEAAPTPGYWQLVLGCRRAGVSALHLGPGADPAVVARLAPTVIAGHPERLTALLSECRRTDDGLAGIRTVLALGPPVGAAQRARAQELAGGAPVVAAWAPPGVRAVWAECRGGATGTVPAGYHAWRDDVLELGADDELLWTGLGWGGTALLRLRTFAIGEVATAPCPACGAATARVAPHRPVAAPEAPATGNGREAAPPPGRIEAVVGQDPEVTAWLVEYRTVDGSPEAVVTVAPAPGVAEGALVDRLDRQLQGPRIVVKSAAEVHAEVEAAGGAHVIGAPPA